MKTRWIIAGAAVLLVAGAMPWGIGYVTEMQWQQATRELNQSQPVLQVQTDAYRRGLLSAELEGELVVKHPETGERQRIPYQASVSHGVLGSLMDFEPAGGWNADWFPDKAPTLTLESRLWGTATLELTAPAMAIPNVEADATLRSSGGLVRVDIGNLGSEIDALMVWPALRLEGTGFDLNINDVHMEQSMTHLSGDLWTGKGELSVDTVAISQTDAPPITLAGLTVRSETEVTENDTRLDSSLSLDLDRLSIGDDAMGPHHLGFTFGNLDVASWSLLTDSLTELRMLALSGQTGAAHIEQQMAVMERVNTAIRNLAAAGFSAAMTSLRVMTPEGAVTGNAVIEHPQLTAREKTEMLMVMHRLTGHLNLSLPAALAEDYPDLRMQFAPLIKQGLLVQKGDELVMQAVMADLVLTVNDQPIPLPPLL